MSDSKPASAKTLPEAKPFLGVPAYFRCRCRKASFGGGSSYREAGWHLAIHIREEQSYDYETDEEFEARLAVLASRLSNGERKAVLSWFVEEYPRCLQLVPKRRRQAFLDGVFDAFEQKRMDLIP